MSEFGSCSSSYSYYPEARSSLMTIYRLTCTHRRCHFHELPHTHMTVRGLFFALTLNDEHPGMKYPDKHNIRLLLVAVAIAQWYCKFSQRKLLTIWFNYFGVWRRFGANLYAAIERDEYSDSVLVRISTFFQLKLWVDSEDEVGYEWKEQCSVKCVW